MSKAKIVKVENGQATYDDGSIRWAKDNELGKKPGTLVSRPLTAAPLFDSQTASQLARARHQDRRDAADAGMLAAAKSAGKSVNIPAEAFGSIVEARTKSALGSEPGAVQDARFVAEATDSMPKRKGEESVPAGARISLEVSEGVAERIMSAILSRQRQKDSEVIEGSFIDLSDDEEKETNDEDTSTSD